MDAEADLLIALEALKNSVHDLEHDLHEIEHTIAHTSLVIGVNYQRIVENNLTLDHTIDGVNAAIGRLEILHDEVRHSEQAIEENRAALVLYCQQFAFTGEMVGPCADLLSCRDR